METVNEIKRLVIETRCTELFGGLGPEMVAVAIELVAGVQRCAPVLNRPEYAYSLIGAICSKRGMDVVGGELTVGGKKVKPEDYIPLWRQAVADRKSLHRALEEDGVELTFVARGHLDRQRAEPRRRTDDPMNGFAGWIEKFGQRMEVDADGYFTLRLAGTEDEACIDWTFISGYGDYQDKDVRNKSTMEVRLITRQKTSLSTPSADETANQAQASLFS